MPEVTNFDFSCNKTNNFADNLVEKTDLPRCFCPPVGNCFELEEEFGKLNMSYNDKANPSSTLLDSEERDMLFRAHRLLNRCLCPSDLNEASKLLISQRTYSFLSLYLRKGGKKLLANVISSPQSFAFFLRLVYEKILDLSASASDSHGVVLSRGPTRKANVSYQRHHPYDEPLDCRPSHSRTQPHLTSGQSYNQNLCEGSISNQKQYNDRDAPNTERDVLQNFIPSESDTSHSYSRSQPAQDDRKLGCQAGKQGGPSSSPSDEELYEQVDYFMNNCLNQEMKDVLIRIFQNPVNFPDLNSIEFSATDEKYETLNLQDEDGDVQDLPSTPLNIPSPSDMYQASSPGIATLIPLANLADANLSARLHPVSTYSPLFGETSPHLAMEKLSTLDINTSSNNPVFPIANDSIHKEERNALMNFRSAKEEMLARMNPTELEISMRKLVRHEDREILQRDEDGDTQLMIACANPNVTLEEIFALTERLKIHPKQFELRNIDEKSALMLAAMEKRPLVAGYIAETMISLGLTVNQTDSEGNNIIHLLSKLGDDYAVVLEYLLRIQLADGKCAFDIGAFNYQGKTALHEAIVTHSAEKNEDNEICTCYQIVHLLLDHGADATLRDATSGRTPVHYAIEKQDFGMLETLLTRFPASANAVSYNNNTPLHIAGTLLNVTEEQQLGLVRILLKHGADKTLRNKAKKLPIEVVPKDRKKVKEVLMARPRQNRPS